MSTLDAVAWHLHQQGLRGDALVLADAMRKEVYPVRYMLGDAGIERLNVDTVVKARLEAESLGTGTDLLIAGDALVKYADLFAPAGTIADESL